MTNIIILVDLSSDSTVLSCLGLASTLSPRSVLSFREVREDSLKSY